MVIVNGVRSRLKLDSWRQRRATPPIIVQMYTIKRRFETYVSSHINAWEGSLTLLNAATRKSSNLPSGFVKVPLFMAEAWHCQVNGSELSTRHQRTGKKSWGILSKDEWCCWLWGHERRDGELETLASRMTAWCVWDLAGGGCTILCCRRPHRFGSRHSLSF
jgi:hypothetical protein